MDYTTLTDDEFQAVKLEVEQEANRRAALRETPIIIDRLLTQNLNAAGVTQGAAWVQPTGAHDAYPAGWRVTHNEKEWESTVLGNVWEPGVSGWREIPAEGSGPAEYVQPTGAHDAYALDDLVTFEGQVWKSTINGNVWSPLDNPNGWVVVQPS